MKPSDIKVKPLEWGFDEYNDFSSKTCFGIYVLRTSGLTFNEEGQSWLSEWLHIYRNEVTDQERQEMKDMAQKHHEEKVLSLLQLNE